MLLQILFKPFFLFQFFRALFILFIVFRNFAIPSILLLPQSLPQFVAL